MLVNLAIYTVLGITLLIVGPPTINDIIEEVRKLRKLRKGGDEV